LFPAAIYEPAGCDSAEPMSVVGMQRSDATLVEQMI
jgi:hypothetical protein